MMLSRVPSIFRSRRVSTRSPPTDDVVPGLTAVSSTESNESPVTDDNVEATQESIAAETPVATLQPGAAPANDDEDDAYDSSLTPMEKLELENAILKQEIALFPETSPVKKSSAKNLDKTTKKTTKPVDKMATKTEKVGKHAGNGINRLASAHDKMADGIKDIGVGHKNLGAAAKGIHVSVNRFVDSVEDGQLGNRIDTFLFGMHLVCIGFFVTCVAGALRVLGLHESKFVTGMIMVLLLAYTPLPVLFHPWSRRAITI